MGLKQFSVQYSTVQYSTVVYSTDVDFDGIITTRYHFMLQSWYQKTAQSPVNTLVSFS